MKYREFGKTGKKVSVLGLGCMRLPEKEINGEKVIDEKVAIDMIHYSIEKGINYFDTAYPYHGGQSEPFLGKALKGFREKVYIASKSPVWKVEKEEDFDKFLDEQLEKLQTNYIDFYLLHALNKNTWNKCKEFKVFDFIERAKKTGKIKHIGFSFHDGYDVFEEIINSYDWEFCQIQLNYIDINYQAGMKGMQVAAEKDIPVVIMEPLRGGMLVNNIPEKVQEIFDSSETKRKPVEWALNWLWNYPEIKIILSGMSNMEQLKENIKLAENASENMFTEKENFLMNEVKKFYDQKMLVKCTSCGYCIPCPQGIPINNVFLFYNETSLFGKYETAKRFYKSLIENGKDVSKCVECGQCESACPQNISIIEKLKEAEKALK